MKTIEQLLELTKNPYYVFLPDEQEVLDNFLAKKREERSKNSPKKTSDSSERNTRVIVRNIVPKTRPQPEEAPEPTESV